MNSHTMLAVTGASVSLCSATDELSEYGAGAQPLKPTVTAATPMDHQPMRLPPGVLDAAMQTSGSSRWGSVSSLAGARGRYNTAIRDGQVVRDRNTDAEHEIGSSLEERCPLDGDGCERRVVAENGVPRPAEHSAGGQIDSRRL